MFKNQMSIARVTLVNGDVYNVTSRQLQYLIEGKLVKDYKYITRTTDADMLSLKIAETVVTGEIKGNVR